MSIGNSSHWPDNFYSCKAYKILKSTDRSISNFHFLDIQQNCAAVAEGPRDVSRRCENYYFKFMQLSR